MKKNVSRRNFIHTTILGTSGIILSANCMSFQRDKLFASNLIPHKLKEANFDHGVASFDPTSSQVIIWTRYTTKHTSIPIVWQIAKDSKFKNIVRSGKVIADQQRDYTVSVEVRELEAGQKLYYRFVQL